MKNNYFFKVLVLTLSICFLSFAPKADDKTLDVVKVNTNSETNYNDSASSSFNEEMNCYVEMPTLSQNGSCVQASALPNSFGDDVEFMWAENVNGSIQARTPWSQNTALSYCPPSSGDFRLCARTAGCSDIYETEDIHLSAQCGSIDGIYIYDQSTDQAVLGPISNGQEIDVNSLPNHYYLVADTSGGIGSVFLTVDDTSITENTPPFTFPAGANNGSNWEPNLGNISVDASAYLEDSRNGGLCDTLHVTFVLIDDNGINPPTVPNCDAGDLIWTNDVSVNNDGSVNADVRFINGGNYTIPGPYPAALSGPSTVSINEAISWDGYSNRVNVYQEFEQWRIVFLKNGAVQYSSQLTGDPADNVASAEWIGALDQNINLPNGADQIILAHIEDSQYGDGSRASANSVVPSSICISVEGVTIEPPTVPTCDAGDFIWTNDVTVNSNGSVNADVRFINGGNFVVPGPYPEELSGPSTVNINEAISWDGYANRVNVNQEFEQWRIVFLKNGVVQYSSQLTEDTPDLVASGEWIGALDQNIELPNGADQIILAHIEDGEYGDGSRSSSNSVVPSSICISAEAICDLTVDAGDAIEVCEDETVELTATAENANVCEGGCEYPIIESVRCNNSNMAEIWISNAGQDHFNTTLNSSFEVLDNGVATYSSRVSNGTDILDVSLTFSGRTTTPPTGSPKLGCDTGNTSDYVYWTSTSGTIVSQQHGTFQVSRMGEAFQLGLGGDVTREGFGASGWLTITGGDGYYERGDINIKLGECNPIGGDSTVEYVWTTEDGNIVGDPNQNTITVDQSGTYKVVAKDCKDCEAEDEVVVNLLEKVVIGNFVWVDVNENGLQDDGATGVNGVNVTLFQANGTEVASTTTANDPNSGDAGYYEFEVCQESGDYYIVFDNIPDGFEITDQNVGGDDAVDSDINPNGRTDDFTITTEDD
ncbi:SdrD B-like domain-containing protein, partial [Croceitalea vernalis]